MFLSYGTFTYADRCTDNSNIEQELTTKIAKNFKIKAQKEPVFLLIGGFQGAGKSSLIKRLMEIYEANVISTDAIRQSLLDLKAVDVSVFPSLVSTVSKNLTLVALKLNTHVLIDANAHAQRIKESKASMSEKFLPKTSLDRADFKEIPEQSLEDTSIRSNDSGVSLQYHEFSIHLDRHFDLPCLKDCLKILKEITCCQFLEMHAFSFVKCR